MKLNINFDWADTKKIEINQLRQLLICCTTWILNIPNSWSIASGRLGWASGSAFSDEKLAELAWAVDKKMKYK